MKPRQELDHELAEHVSVVAAEVVEVVIEPTATPPHDPQ
jgi:hypothetical protein